METKRTQVVTGNDLLKARQETLKNLTEQPLRPQGKLWNMDVFSWGWTSEENIINTIHAMPNKVVWVGRYKEIKAVLGQDPSVISNISQIIALEKDPIVGSIIFPAVEFSIVGTISDAFGRAADGLQKGKVFLFTSTTKEWSEDISLFESHLTYLRG
jgi:hypothetical protein